MQRQPGRPWGNSAERSLELCSYPSSSKKITQANLVYVVKYKWYYYMRTKYPQKARIE
jgi:hypothetical protein